MPRITVQENGQWWIMDDEDPLPIGPYKTKEQAEDDRKGLDRFYRHCNEPGYITSDKRSCNAKI